MKPFSPHIIRSSTLRIWRDTGDKERNRLPFVKVIVILFNREKQQCSLVSTLNYGFRDGLKIECNDSLGDGLGAISGLKMICN